MIWGPLGGRITPKSDFSCRLVCHSNSKLVFHFLVTNLCLSSLTVLSPSDDIWLLPKSRTFGGSNHPPKVTLVVWLVCHSNSKLAFCLLVTIIYLSSLTVLSPSKDTNIYPRHMIATKKWDNSWGLGGQNTPKLTLFVWLVCHSNSKLAFHFLVTIICLSSVTVMSPSIIPRCILDQEMLTRLRTNLKLKTNIKYQLLNGILTTEALNDCFEESCSV